MIVKLKSIFKKHNNRRLSVQRVSFLGVYLAILMTLKYALGFIPGIEMVTFMFIIAGLFIPFTDGLILIISFNVLMIALYGWGTWQIMYWLIWPFNFVTSKIIYKFTKNKYLISIWGFVCGFLIAFWYFISDLALYGSSYAYLNIISAIPINLIEGFITSFLIIATLPILTKVFALNSQRLWNYEIKQINEKDSQYSKKTVILTVIINLVLASAIVLLFVYNQVFLDLKDTMTDHSRATAI